MRYAIAAVLAIAYLPAASLAADVYRSVDAQGNVRYSDTPSPGAQLISVNTATSDDASTSTPAASATDAGSDADEQVARQRAERVVAQEEAQKRSDACKQAQDAYQKAMDSRRIYQTGADGQREYLSDDAADQSRVNLRLQMESLCKDVQ